MSEIIIDFFPDGTVKVEAEGFVGSSCKEAAAFLENLGTKYDEELKPEFYDDAEEHLYAR